MSRSWIRAAAEGAVLTLQIQPGAKRSEVVGLHGEALKIRLTAPPVEGKANARLIKFLGEKLGVPAAQIQILSGQSSRSKRVLILEMSVDKVCTRLHNE